MRKAFYTAQCVGGAKLGSKHDSALRVHSPALTGNAELLPERRVYMRHRFYFIRFHTPIITDLNDYANFFWKRMRISCVSDFWTGLHCKAVCIRLYKNAIESCAFGVYNCHIIEYAYAHTKIRSGK